MLCFYTAYIQRAYPVIFDGRLHDKVLDTQPITSAAGAHLSGMSLRWSKAPRRRREELRRSPVRLARLANMTPKHAGGLGVRYTPDPVGAVGISRDHRSHRVRLEVLIVDTDAR